MVSIKSKSFTTAKSLCDWINDNKIDQSQIVSISEHLSYTLFYYE